MDQFDVDEKIERFERTAVEVLMKLFISACRNGREQRAYEVASIMSAQALQLAIKYATKSRALNLAQHLNALAERKAELELREQQQLQQQQHHQYESQTATDDYDQSRSISFLNNTANNHKHHSVEDSADDIVIERVTQTTQQAHKSSGATSHTPKLSDATNSQLNATNASDCDTSTYKTPILTPLAGASRLNPFAKNNNLSGKISQTPSNDTPKSVLNKIEEKLLQQSAGSTASIGKTDSWRPISTKKSALKPKP